MTIPFSRCLYSSQLNLSNRIYSPLSNGIPSPMKHILFLTVAAIATLLIAEESHAKVWQVGSTRTYTKPSSVMALVSAGDTVEIDPETYTADVGVWSKDNLVIRGTSDNTFAHLAAGGANAQGKAIWVISGANAKVENIEFSGASVPDHNGAGIRQEGSGLWVKHCYFHDNEDGILAGDNPTSDIVIEASEFSHNGYGDGYTHNMYINHVKSFTLKFSYSHGAKVGHNVKSRAYSNFILYNRIMDEADGTASYEIDLPNGGHSVVLGNSIMKGTQAQNSVLVNYGAEGITNATNDLYVINNTMVTERNATFIRVAAGTTTAKIINNLLIGKGTVYNGTADTLSNLHYDTMSDTMFSNLSDPYDYHPRLAFQAIFHGVGPGRVVEMDLTPRFQYEHPLDSEARWTFIPDIGAYDLPVVLNNVRSLGAGSAAAAYPNPFTTSTTIALPSATIRATELQTLHLDLYDLAGKVLRSEPLHVSHGTVSIERRALQTGTYYYTLHTTTGALFTSGKLIVE